MCWADRLALVWAGFLTFVYFVMCGGPGGPIDPKFWYCTPLVWLYFAAPIWLLLRGLRWTFHRGA